MSTVHSQSHPPSDTTQLSSSRTSAVNWLMLIRIAFWAVALTCGVAQTWSVRHDILSDGISYIEIAQAYMRLDWPNALNAYWSPLYSWFLALAFGVLRPAPYWQVATAHLVLLISFIASLVSFEYFLHQLAAVLYNKQNSVSQLLSRTTLYLTGYSALLFGGLSLVDLWYCSPDMIGFALTFLILGLLLHIARNATPDLLFVSLGAACALFYLARTAFAPSIAVCFVIFMLLLRRQHRPFFRPALLFLGTVLILCAPFVIAISVKTGRFTIGESGRLNYGWEVDGAERFLDWEGKPFDIGHPLHPTHQVSDNPKAFVFAEPVAGTYPPWYDPSYWFAGLKPRIKPGAFARVLFVNVTVAIRCLAKSPIFMPACLIILIAGIGCWWSTFLRLWPILVPTVFGLAVYCLVYFEKRYIAANLVVLWIAMLAGLRFSNSRQKLISEAFLNTCVLLFLCAFVLRKDVNPAKVTLRDLTHHSESSPSIDSLLAEKLDHLGLRPGDKIAYIGTGINANWARLAQVKIVAEIPLMYGRNLKPLNNTLLNDTTQISAFWRADQATKQNIYRAFRSAGAKMVVTDGFFCADLSRGWPRVLPENQGGIPHFDPSSYSQINTRYFPLENLGSK